MQLSQNNSQFIAMKKLIGSQEKRIKSQEDKLRIQEERLKKIEEPPNKN